MALHLIFFYATVLLLPTQLGRHFWPEWSFLLGRRIDYLSPTFFLTDITIFLMFLSLLIQTKFQAFRFVIITKKNLVYLVSFISFVFLNILFSSSPPVAGFAWVKIFEMLFVTWYIVHEKPPLSTTLILISCSIVYSSLLAIFQFSFQRSLGGILWFIGERSFSISTPGIAKTFLDFPPVFFLSDTHLSLSRLILRPYATFPHPNVLGGFLAITIPFLWMKQPKKILSRIFFFSTLAVGLSALLLSCSKTALAAFFIGLLLQILYIFRFRKKTLVLFVLLSSMLFSIFIKISAGTTFKESVQDRIELQKSAQKIFIESPVVGVGLNNFLIRLPDVSFARKIFFLQPVHSVYSLLLSEIGLLGILCIIIFLVPVYVLWKKKKKDRNTVFLSIAVVQLLFLGLFDHYLLTTQQGRLLTSLVVGFFLLQIIRKAK